MTDTRTLTLGDQTLEFEAGRLAKQANGAVTVRCGDTLVLGTATMSSKPREHLDFFPLTCDYEERMYSVGKIPGGFFKREGRPSERAILTCRLIDRPTRPLFPDGMRNEVQVVTMPLSVDQDFPPDMLALNAASAALALSDIPWNGPFGAVRIGMIDDEFILNPTREDIDVSDLDLVVAGTLDTIVMVEAGANQIPEAKILEAMRFAHENIKLICTFISEWRDAVGKPKTDKISYRKADPELLAAAQEHAGEVRAALQNPDKAAREDAMDEVKAEVVAKLAERFPDRLGELGDAVEKITKQQLRSLIIEEKKRPDGRGPEDIRQISSEVGVLPRAHGSGLFTRGQTQVLSVATLGGTSEDQMIDGLGEEASKEYMHHYNFPPFSVGEARPMRGPGRREIGHGALAERAIKSVLPDKEKFPYVIRVVSDVLESNGSTSMASTCGSTLALMDAGVPLKAPVSGIAMGLMTEGDKYVVLSDIQGMEDFGGDMDFKVAGSREGVTAIQMDTKISGLPWAVVEDALAQAYRGRIYIMDKMLAALEQPREQLSPHAPRIFTIEIHPERIGDIIGPGGKIIKKIQADTESKIDIEQDGRVFVAAPDQERGDAAIRMIEALTKQFTVGEEVQGRITRLMGKGAMMEIAPGKEGLIPTHELSHHRIGRPDDVVKMGDEVHAKIISIDFQGRIDLSRKALLNPDEEPEPAQISPPRPERDRDRDRDRGPRGGGGRGGGGRDRGPRDSGPRDSGPRGDGGPRGGDIPPRPSGETGVGARFRPPRRQE
jgi:polyribonucleotide nucleotidyltransferase